MSRKAVALVRQTHHGLTLSLFQASRKLHVIRLSPNDFIHAYAIIGASRCSSKQSWRNLKRKLDIGAANGKEYDYPSNEVSSEAKGRLNHQESSWVPPAYRGIGSDVRGTGRRPADRSSGGGTKGNSRYAESRSERRRGRTSQHQREWEGTRSSTSTRGEVVLENDETERIRMVKREKEESISNLLNELDRLSATYLRHFEKNVTSLPLEGSKSIATLPPANVQRHVLNVLKKIHTSIDDPVTLRQVEASEVDFRYLCRALRHMCSLACGLSNSTRYDDRDAGKYLDLSEFLLLQLVKLDQGRNILMETARMRKTTQPPTMATNKSSSEDESLRTVTGWFSKLVEGFVPSLTSGKEPRKTSSTDLGHEAVHAGASPEAPEDDSHIQSMKRLLRIVLRSIAASVQLDEGKEQRLYTRTTPGMANTSLAAVDTMTAEYRTACETCARRMLDLLDGMPLSWSPDTEAVRYVMETLCRAGTPQGARMSVAIFQRFSSPDCRLQFALVLESYLEAVKLEHDPNKLAILVAEVVDLLTTQWNSSWPSHRVDRILQCSIVLHCMAIGNMGRLAGMCERGDGIVTRTLGNIIANSFRQELDADQPNMDKQTLPLVNHLAHLYATSSDESRVLASKKMLKYMMHNDSIMMYPNTGTCNAVLLALIQLHEFTLAARNKTEEMKAARLDFAFAQDVLNFMLTRSDTGCGPNEHTLEVFFRFLDAINPPDVGDMAEDLLTVMEAQKARHSFSQLPDGEVKIPLSAYHRVMRYWLQVAKMPFDTSTGPTNVSSSLPCERALRILKKLEVQSIPSALSDSALDNTSTWKLYDTGLRPVRKTYKLVMQICAYTSNLDDYEKAAGVVFKVQQMMDKRRFPSGDDTDAILWICSSRLATDSRLRREIGNYKSELGRAFPS